MRYGVPLFYSPIIGPLRHYSILNFPIMTLVKYYIVIWRHDRLQSEQITVKSLNPEINELPRQKTYLRTCAPSEGTKSIRPQVNSYLSQFALILVNSYSFFGQFVPIFFFFGQFVLIWSIRTLWPESSLGTLLIAEDAKFLHVDNEDLSLRWAHYENTPF